MDVFILFFHLNIIPLLISTMGLLLFLWLAACVMGRKKKRMAAAKSWTPMQTYSVRDVMMVSGGEGLGGYWINWKKCYLILTTPFI